MTSREIILANLNHENPPRPGLTFSGGRADDMLAVGVSPAGYEQKRWVEGNQEFYDDVWGNVWCRMVATFKGGFIGKNYPDLPGIGVKPEWDQWAYAVMAGCEWSQ